MTERLEAIDLAGRRREPALRLDGATGILPRQDIRTLVNRNILRATIDIEESQYQPASLDLRLGEKAHRVRASFLPGRAKSVEEQLAELSGDVLSLSDGAVLERGCVYVVELLEYLEALPEHVSAIANPKSSTGRLDVFTRLISDRSEMFDHVASRYSGRLYTEISPSSFSIKVRRGSRLNQLRFRRRNSNQPEHGEFKLKDKRLAQIHDEVGLVDRGPKLRNGLLLHIELCPLSADGIIGYRAQRYTDVIDVDKVGAYEIHDYWEPIHARADRRLVLDPNQFYILVSKERLHIPPNLAAEMVPIDPMMGEFRVHYAGFFDPGFGYAREGHPGSRAVLEVRSHEVPFVLEDGQVVGRLAYEEMAAIPDRLYGEGGSSYQGQALKLSKHFRSG